MKIHRWFRLVLALGVALALAGCTPPPPLLQHGPDGRPLPMLYPIAPQDGTRIRFRMLNHVNSLRAGAGVPPVVLRTELTAAAAAHARDMAAQTRPTHVGSDGSSPVARADAAGYRGRILGETIAETYLGEDATIAAWMGLADTRDAITDPQARDLGVGFHQEPSGKIWWVLVLGDGGPRPVPGG